MKPPGTRAAQDRRHPPGMTFRTLPPCPRAPPLPSSPAVERVFRIGQEIAVPDGTVVRPLFQPPDGGPFSIAAGELAPGTRSKVHVLPRGTQVTFVLSGTLTVRMRGPADRAPYALRLGPHEACLTLPGERLQLENATAAAVRVLYVVAPPYRAETDAAGNVLHEDAVLLDGWDDGGDAP
jgi:mannose-6-phosphate isomerase-like protein (cupin superfamily)